MKANFLLVVIAAVICLPCFADVVINEIAYNPPDADINSGSLKEFIELYNPGSESIDLTGYYFTRGLTYTFPEGTIVSSGDYIILVRDNTNRVWRRPSAPVIGPFEGALADGGERIELARPDGTIVGKRPLRRPISLAAYRGWIRIDAGTDRLGPSRRRFSQLAGFVINRRNAWRGQFDCWNESKTLYDGVRSESLSSHVERFRDRSHGF